MSQTNIKMNDARLYALVAEQLILYQRFDDHKEALTKIRDLLNYFSEKSTLTEIVDSYFVANQNGVNLKHYSLKCIHSMQNDLQDLNNSVRFPELFIDDEVQIRNRAMSLILKNIELASLYVYSTSDFVSKFHEFSLTEATASPKS